MTLKINQTTQTTVFGISAASLAVVLGIVGLTGLGLVMLQTIDQADLPARLVPKHLFRNQMIYLLVAVVTMLIVRAFNYQRLVDWAYPFFIVMLILLLTVLIVVIFGIVGIHLPFLDKFFPKINGSYRWIRLGFFQIQPSEFIKIAYILGLARYLRYRKNYRQFGGLLGPFALTLFPMILILLEPDLGTVMLLLPVLFIMLYAAGAKIKHLAAVVLLMVMSLPLLFSLMHGYQRDRVVGMLLQSENTRNWIKKHPGIKNIIYRDKSLDRSLTEEGYHLYHSKIALGSGSVMGFGLGKGPYMDGSRWLPECHNDFVFAMIGHQFGFIGTVSVVLLYLIIAVGLVEIAAEVAEPFGRLIVVGVLAMLLTQAGINMGMTLGLMPITGVTLPFISYGGSSLLTYFILMGLALSVDRARPVHIGPKPFEFSDEDY
ncbi:MAG: FtsW/RodA/SpoVE family cell cycle protein [Phycisphaerae bacterium]